mgnify:CR=1 FL=1
MRIRVSPRTPVHSVSVHYSHEAQEDERGGSLWHSITVELPGASSRFKTSWATLRQLPLSRGMRWKSTVCSPPQTESNSPGTPLTREMVLSGNLESR